MSARSIPENLEAEVVAKHKEGSSLRAISAWLKEEKGVTASYEAVSGMLLRRGVASTPNDELICQLREHSAELSEQFFECLHEYRNVLAEALNPETKVRVTTALQAVKAWASALIWAFRAAGLPLPSRMPMPKPPLGRALGASMVQPGGQKADRKQGPVARELDEVLVGARSAEASPIRKPSTPALITRPVMTMVTPPRNQPCPCGSGAKWKKCCGSPTKAAPGKVASSALSG